MIVSHREHRRDSMGRTDFVAPSLPERHDSAPRQSCLRISGNPDESKVNLKLAYRLRRISRDQRSISGGGHVSTLVSVFFQASLVLRYGGNVGGPSLSFHGTFVGDELDSGRRITPTVAAFSP
jgi:hypothetical protein